MVSGYLVYILGEMFEHGFDDFLDLSVQILVLLRVLVLLAAEFLETSVET